MQFLSREQVLGLAPDPAAAKVAQGQASPTMCTGLGHDEVAVWGECQGSGSSPYRCQAALADGAARCSCPSRKFPCKHALGLLLLLADGAVPAGTCPDWVTEWVAARAATRPAATSSESEPANPAAQQRRAASRERRVDDGAAELLRWLHDLARGGLAAAQAQPWTWWDRVARRMVDAQARRLAELAAAGGQRSDWPDRMLDQIGALYLMCEAWKRRDDLPAATAAAVRVRIGFITTSAEVLASGERVTDCWAVLSNRRADDGQLASLQQRLYGERTGAVVTYLAFAAGGQQLEPGLPPGTRSEATVALYPGTVPARVLIADRGTGPEPLGPLPGAACWDEALAAVAANLSVDPWADVLPVAVRGVTVIPADRGAASSPVRPWQLRDTAGRTVPVAGPPQVRWRLLSLSAGNPVDVAGEWDGFSFIPQAAGVAAHSGS